MPKIDKLLQQYCKEYPHKSDISHSALASKFLEENPDIKTSHRSLRRRISRLRDPKSKKANKEESRSTTQLTYKGRRSLTSEQEAIEFFEVDLDKYVVTKFRCRSWDVTMKGGKVYTNYYVALDLEPKKDPVNLDLLHKRLKNAVQKGQITHSVQKSSNVGVLGLADFHVGARIVDIVGLEDFTYEVIISRLRKIAQQINEKNFSEVHICLLGDFIETFTGLNHPDTWKGIERDGYGMRVVVMAYEILRDFLQSIHNLKSVNIVAGNHDRVSANNKEDTNGEAAYMISYLLKKTFEGLEVNYDPLIVKKEVDGILYLLTHMHYKVASADYGKFMFKYGDQSIFNVVMGGHLHTRKKKVGTTDKILADEDKYRIIHLPPIFTGNPYSLRNGWTSKAGYNLFSNNGAGYPDMEDRTI